MLPAAIAAIDAVVTVPSCRCRTAASRYHIDNADEAQVARMDSWTDCHLSVVAKCARQMRWLRATVLRRRAEALSAAPASLRDSVSRTPARLAGPTYCQKQCHGRPQPDKASRRGVSHVYSAPRARHAARGIPHEPSRETLCVSHAAGRPAGHSCRPSASGRSRSPATSSTSSIRGC
eukprot:COSAG06_NODE_829_length_12043_cov_8.656983_6_plen_177_part_00